jgi:uncharacterized protein YbjT (DUF2867 family)
MPETLVAGATGDLGARVTRELLALGATVRVLTRPGSDSAERQFGQTPGVTIVTASYDDPAALRRAVAGVDVVVSAVSGVRSVIVDAQGALLDAAVAEGVPRFVPSDYSADYRSLPPGSNRNLEMRREFAGVVDAAPIRATSVLNGAFADMLTGQAPIVLRDRHLVLFWSDADQVLDFTSKDDVAAVTAAVALDAAAPRYVEVAGDRLSARDLARVMSEVTGEPFRVQWAGTTGTLLGMSKAMRRFSREGDEAFPAWQGMQYLVSMYSGDGQLRHVDEALVSGRGWTTARDVLAAEWGTPAA